jgi:hypothetical protein
MSFRCACHPIRTDGTEQGMGGKTSPGRFVSLRPMASRYSTTLLERPTRYSSNRLGWALAASLCAHLAVAIPAGPAPRHDAIVQARLTAHPAALSAMPASEGMRGSGPAWNTSRSLLDRSSHTPISSEPALESASLAEEGNRPASVIAVGELPDPDPMTEPGRAILVVQVDELGMAASITVEENTLPETYLSSILEIFQNASFSPALVSGKPARGIRRIEVTVGDPAQPPTTT